MRAAVVGIFVVLFALAQSVVTTQQAGAEAPTWTPIQAPGPVADSTGYHLNAVDCWAVGDCVAVGYHSGGGTFDSFIDQETDGAWSWVSSTTSGLDLTAVSCPAAGACVAVGTAGQGTSDLDGVLDVQSGSTWTTIAATGPGARYASYTGSLTGVSCPAAGSCAAVGQAQDVNEVSTGFTLTLEPGSDPTTPASWAAERAPEPAADAQFEDAGLAGVSCVSAGNCRAVGFAHNSSNFSEEIPLIDEEKNYAWAYGGSPTPSGTPYGQLMSVSCIVGGTVCMAGGDDNNNRVPFVATIDTDTDMSEATDELPAGFTSGELSASSCAPDGQCQSVGQTYAKSGVNYGYDGLIVSDRYGATAGTSAATSTATDSPADANTIEHIETLDATSCVSGGYCVSVGSYVDNSGPQSQNEASVIDTRTYDSTGAITSESDIQAPEPADDTADDDQNILYGVWCGDSSHCTAVGAYFNDSDQSRGVIDTLGSTPATPVPAVTSVRGSRGPTAGGTTVTITGSGLAGATAVRFGTTPGSSLHITSGTTLTVRAPKHAAGAVDVRVTSPGGTSAIVKADRYTYVGAPAVTRVSPSSGPLRGGGTVVLTGSNLSGVTSVRFGTTAGKRIKVVSATRLEVTAPAHAAGATYLHVSTAGGTNTLVKADRYVYVASPGVTKISPASGSHRGGANVVITGRYLSGATAVRFGSTAGKHVKVVSSTRLEVVAPAHTRGTVNVQVTTVGGTSAKVRADYYRFT